MPDCGIWGTGKENPPLDCNLHSLCWKYYYRTPAWFRHRTADLRQTLITSSYRLSSVNSISSVLSCTRHTPELVLGHLKSSELGLTLVGPCSFRLKSNSKIFHAFRTVLDLVKFWHSSLHWCLVKEGLSLLNYSLYELFHAMDHISWLSVPLLMIEGSMNFLCRIKCKKFM